MKLLIRVAGLLYSTLLFYIFFLARRRPHPTFLQHKGQVNLIPLKNKIDFLNYQHVESFYKWNFITDLFGNIGLFIPLPFFLRFIFNIKNPWAIMLVAVGMSVCVECAQFIFSIGVADIDDVILNTLGAVTGIAVMMAVKKYWPRLYYSFDAGRVHP